MFNNFLFIFFIIIILHFFVKENIIEKYQNYDYIRNCTDTCSDSCKNNKKNIKCYDDCINKCLKKKDDKKNVHIGCLQTEDRIKFPLYKDNKNNYTYLYDSEIIKHNKIKNKNKLTNKWYKQLIKENNPNKTYKKLNITKIKSGDCIYNPGNNLNKTKIILDKKCKNLKKINCKTFI